MKRYLLITLATCFALLYGGGGNFAWAQIETVTLTSSESAYSDQSAASTPHDGSSADITYLKSYYTQFRDWNSGVDGSVKVNSGGKIAFYKFDLSNYKNFNGALVSATFSFTITGSGDGKQIQKIRALGYNGSWEASTLTNSNISNTGAANTAERGKVTSPA